MSIIPLILSENLEPRRADFEVIVEKALRLTEEFARCHGWEGLTEEPFMHRVEIYGHKEELDDKIRRLTDEYKDQAIPATYSAGLEEGVLFAVSPEIYDKNYPDGREPDSFVKLLAHEIIHRLHVRILKGDEDAMGPIWFFEGFAIHGCGQFAGRHPKLSPRRIREIVNSSERGSYLEYSSVFDFLLTLAPLSQLVKQAGDSDFTEWINKRI